MAEPAVAEDSAPRCIGCGKPVESGKTFLILVGTSHDGEFSESDEHGRLHYECFNRAVESPRSVLEEVRRLAEGKSRLRKV